MELKEILDLIVTKRFLTQLAINSGVSINTVYATFKHTSPKELSGKQLKVYNEAIKIVKFIRQTESQSVVH